MPRHKWNQKAWDASIAARKKKYPHGIPSAVAAGIAARKAKAAARKAEKQASEVGPQPTA